MDVSNPTVNQSIASAIGQDRPVAKHAVVWPAKTRNQGRTILSWRVNGKTDVTVWRATVWKSIVSVIKTIVNAENIVDAKIARTALMKIYESFSFQSFHSVFDMYLSRVFHEKYNQLIENKFSRISFFFTIRLRLKADWACFDCWISARLPWTRLRYYCR